MKFNNLRIRTRIIIGFGTLIVISLLLAGTAVYRLADVGTAAESLQFLAGRIEKVLDGTRRLEAMRRAEVRMRLDGQGADEAREKLAQVIDLVADDNRVTRSDELRRIYTEVQEMTRRHGEALDHFIALITTAFQNQAALFKTGEILTRTSGQLFEAARAVPDPDVSAAAAALNAGIPLIRLTVLRFMATLEKDRVPLFNTDRDKLTAAIDALRAGPPEISALADQVAAALRNYDANFQSFASARLSSADFADAEMRPQVAAMQQSLDKAADTLRRAVATASSDAAAAITSASWLETILATVALLLGGALAAVIGRSIIMPINGLTAVMTSLAGGDNSVAVPARAQTDEIGAMARAVEVFKQNAIAKKALEERQVQEQAAQSRRQEEMSQLVGFFGRSVSGVFTTLAAASENMARSSIALELSAGEAGDQTRMVQTEVQQTAQTVQAVAAAAQQLAASIQEIGTQASQSQRISTDAMQQSDEVVAKVAELREAAQQIGTVVELINTIAGQTNLLALNATIEAARAGDAGKGFAVVASEVKSLAAQTARATGQIGGQINAIQAATMRAAEAIQGIAGTVRQVNEIAMAIAAAVLEQGAATQEIARSVELVSGNTAVVAESMQRVQGTVSSNGETATEVKRTASTLSSESSHLSEEVRDFLAALGDLGGDERLLTYEVDLPATVTFEGRSVAGRVTRMSPGTALFAGPLSAPPGAVMDLQVQGFDQKLRARFVESTAAGVHLQLPLGHEHLTRAAQTLARLGLKVAA